MQHSSNVFVGAQDEDLLVTEFSIIGHTSSSSSSSSTLGGSSTSGFESTASTGSGSTENLSNENENISNASPSDGVSDEGSPTLASSPSTRQYIAVTQSSIIKRKNPKPESTDVEVHFILNFQWDSTSNFNFVLLFFLICIYRKQLQLPNPIRIIPERRSHKMVAKKNRYVYNKLIYKTL